MIYFNYSEFDSPDQPGSGEAHMDPEFLEMLDKARIISGVPYNITSGFRTEAHNRSVGGSPTSSHRDGYAADIGYSSKKEALRIIQGLVRAGFRRIGMANTFIHVDNDPNKPEAYWGYE